MENDLLGILVRLLVAMAAGGMIGLERRHNGHAAGFRTHTLVCMASSVLMFLVVYQQNWFPPLSIENARIDPTRMAQGIMTGIGFLGAGVIMKEGLSVQGLTTAASIWITSAIGILAGVGFYVPLAMVTFLTLGTLSIFRWIESKLPSLIYAHCSLCLDRNASIDEKDLRELFSQHGFDVFKLSYAFTRAGDQGFYYNMMIRTRKPQQFEMLSRRLFQLEPILEFKISLTGD